MAKTSYPQRGKRISFSRFNNSSVAEKGHFAVYTADQSQLVFSIPYLNNYIFQELLNMSEEEFGLPSNEPITLPFDAMFIKYAVSLIRGCVDRNLKEAFCLILKLLLNAHDLIMIFIMITLIASSYWLAVVELIIR